MLDHAAICYGALCFACLLAVAFAPVEQRFSAGVAACLFSLKWLMYISAWTETPAAGLFWSVGVPLLSEDLWKITDALFGVACLLLGIRVCALSNHIAWWAWALLSLVVIQELIHGLYDLGWYGDEQFYNLLNATFLGMVACFLLVGGRGGWDWISSRISVRRMVFRPRRVAKAHRR